MKIRIGFLISILAMAWCSFVRADDTTFDIAKFQVVGNSLLPAEEVQSLVSPFEGKKKTYAHIQRALEALEGAYRSRGFGTVQVYVPEQELTGGTVIIQITEVAVDKVSITGNKFFSAENIRRTLPLLREGEVPNLRAISENVQLANENPAKQVDVTLAASEKDDRVDAKIQVADENPEKYIFSLDNTGDKDKTGQYRAGVTYRHGNLFGNDEVLTASYVTGPDTPGGVDLDVYSVGFRIPFYDLGDSLDLIYGKSTVNIPIVVLDGALGLNGKGDVLVARWNHLLPRAGEYSSRVVFGFDYKNSESTCTTGISVGCVNSTLRLASVTYSGQINSAAYLADFNASVSRNLRMGGRNDQWRYNYSAQDRYVDMDFYILKAGGSFNLPVGDWLLRTAVSAQYADGPLPSGEQLGLAGSTAVRGFTERAAASDMGFVMNAELYTPDLLPAVNKSTGMAIPGSMKLLGFIDMANGQNWLTYGQAYIDHTGASRPGYTTINERIQLLSYGLGMRYGIGRDVSVKFDVANVVHAMPTLRTAPGFRAESDWMAHFALSYAF